jgi:hypothetical protein
MHASSLPPENWSLRNIIKQPQFVFQHSMMVWLMIVIKSILFEYNDNKLHFIRRFVDQCYKEIYPFSIREMC